MSPVNMVPPELAAEAVERWGTPLYLTDLDAAGANLVAYREAFPGALIAYAVKANPDPQLLRRRAGQPPRMREGHVECGLDPGRPR